MCVLQSLLNRHAGSTCARVGQAMHQATWASLHALQPRDYPQSLQYALSSWCGPPAQNAAMIQDTSLSEPTSFFSRRRFLLSLACCFHASRFSFYTTAILMVHCE